MTEGIKASALVLDMSSRMQGNSSIVGSPATNAITSVCALTVTNFSNLTVVTGVELEGFVAFTVGTSGTAAKLDIRQTGTSGAVIATTGAVTVSATNLISMSVQGLDASPLSAGVWILALTITGGAATSTVSATQLFATVI